MADAVVEEHDHYYGGTEVRVCTPEQVECILRNIWAMTYSGICDLQMPCECPKRGRIHADRRLTFAFDFPGRRRARREGRDDSRDRKRT
jgi:hypothetical protein